MLSHCFLVLETDEIREAIHILFIGFPQAPIEAFPQFANCTKSDTLHEDKILADKDGHRRTFYISISRSEGIFGKWVDSTLLSITKTFGNSLASISVAGCAKLKDVTLEESIKNIRTLKVYISSIFNRALIQLLLNYLLILYNRNTKTFFHF